MAIAASNDIDPMRDVCEGLPLRSDCRFGSPSAKSTYVLLGDSHAAALRPALDYVSTQLGSAGELWWYPGCPIFEGATNVGADATEGGSECAEFKDAALSELASRPDLSTVILAGRWGFQFTGKQVEISEKITSYLVDDQSQGRSEDETRRVFERSLSRAVAKLVGMGKRVLIVGPIPEPGFDVPVLAALSALNGGRMELGFPDRDLREPYAAIDEIMQRIADAQGEALYVSLWEEFCVDATCKLMVDGIPLYFDDDHLSASAARNYVGPRLLERFGDIFYSPLTARSPPANPASEAGARY